MEKCLPKCLVTRSWMMEGRSWNTKLLVSLSTGVLLIGLGILWFGLKPAQIKQVASPTSTAAVVENTPVSTSSATVTVEGERAQVTKVVDGDTINVSLNGKEAIIRLIGIDTPETVDSRRPVGCFGKEASSKAKGLLSGKKVILEKDVSEKDKYGRLLRYVYLPLEDGQTLFVNDYMVREGYAFVLTYPPDVKYNEQFREAERGARDNKRGLWGRC